MKKHILFAVATSVLTLLPLSAHAVVYINETFEDDTLGAAPTNTTQKNALQVITEAGSGVIGTDNMAHFNDTISGTGGAGDLEYLVGASNTVGSLYVQFDLLNNAGSTSPSAAANPIIFGVGPWSNASGISLGANASRSLGIEFYQTGSSSTLKVRTNATAILNTTYDMAALQTVKLWVNDNDSSSVSYLRPDNSATATLGVNSFVIWINDALLTGETDSGFGLNPVLTVGNTTLGRLGFSSTTTALVNFSIDNLQVTDIAAIPEPSSAALVLGGTILLGWYSRWRTARR